MTGAAPTIVFPARFDVAPLAGRPAAGWIAVHAVNAADPMAANAGARAALAFGATGISLCFPQTPAPGDWAADLDAALAGIDPLQIRIRLEGAAVAADAAREFANLIGRRGVAPEIAEAAFGLSPLNDGARSDDLGRIAADLLQGGFAGQVASLDVRPLDPEGMGGPGALAAILAGALWWVHALEANGIPRRTALSRMGSALAVTQHHIATIARLRALRLLWARLAEVLDAPGAPLAIHAETAPALARGDGHQALVRASIAALAAILGEADSLAIRPPLELPPPDAPRAALNIHHLLREEAGIGAWRDAPAGSGAIEAETDRLAEAAWAILARVQAAGGLQALLHSGKPLAAAFAIGTGP